MCRERKYVRLPNKASGFGGDEGTVHAWKFEEGIKESAALDACWARHTAIFEVDSAELLLVNPHIIKSETTLIDSLDKKKTDGGAFKKEIFGNAHSRLCWCFTGAYQDKIVHAENLVGRSIAEYA
jgi:hypothetical protein